jgi:hypothetical protein
MLQHTKWLLEEREEDGSSLIAIHSRFDKLITALRTAVANEYRLDKEQTSYNDLLDAFRLALIFYKRSKKPLGFFLSTGFIPYSNSGLSHSYKSLNDSIISFP